MEEIEYIEPTQEHVGQVVEVQFIRGTAWVERKLLAILPPPQIERFVCENITDGKPVPARCTLWHRARIPRPLTYAERQAKCGLKVGDRVRFVSAWEKGREQCFLSYGSCMDRYVSSCGTITDANSNGIEVKFNEKSWWLPYFVLEKITDRVATHLDVGGTVYVDGAPQDEFTLSHVFVECQSGSREVFGVVRSSDKRFVYELSNLRVKE